MPPAPAAGRLMARHAALVCTRLADIAPTVILPLDDPLAFEAQISPTQLAALPQIMLPEGSPFRRLVELMFDRENLSFLVRAEARTQSALVTMVAQGAGRAIVGRRLLAAIRAPAVAAVPLAVRLRWPIRVVAPAAAQNMPGLQNFIAELERV